MARVRAGQSCSRSGTQPARATPCASPRPRRTSPACASRCPGADVEHAFYRLYAFVEPRRSRAGWDRDRILRAVQRRGRPCPVRHVRRDLPRGGVRRAPASARPSAFPVASRDPRDVARVLRPPHADRRPTSTTSPRPSARCMAGGGPMTTRPACFARIRAQGGRLWHSVLLRARRRRHRASRRSSPTTRASRASCRPAFARGCPGCRRCGARRLPRAVHALRPLPARAALRQRRHDAARLGATVHRLRGCCSRSTSSCRTAEGLRAVPFGVLFIQAILVLLGAAASGGRPRDRATCAPRSRARAAACSSSAPAAPARCCCARSRTAPSSA